MLHRPIVLGLLAISSAVPAQDPRLEWERSAAETKRICERVGRPKPPAGDRPTPAQARALAGCSAEKLYYGQGVKPDYVKARQCAFLEAQDNKAEVFAGNTILMQLYANGLGVTRDPDLATAYACLVDGAPAEVEGRVAHLQSLKSKPDPSFDYCDDITSGLAMGYCQARDSDHTAVGRDARITALVATLPAAARSLYAPMKKSFDAFVDAHGDEVDQAGTARAAEVIAEQDKARDQFVRDLDRLASGRWPAASSADAQAADAALNASYRKALAYAANADNVGTIKPDYIRKTQRLWLVYRDAYLRFAAGVPGISRDAALARLTRLRTADLDRIANP